MTALRDIQAAFMHDTYSGERTSAGFLDPAVSSEARLNIYCNNTVFGLTEVLANAYPVLKKIVGEEFFRTIAHHYLKVHPQSAGNRHMFGGQLSQFLEAFEPAVTLPYLGDVAALEWAHFQACIANDEIIMDFAALSAAMSLDSAFVMRLHPSVCVLSQTFNALDIWKEHQKRATGTVQLLRRPHGLMVWRGPEDSVLMRRVSPSFRTLLQSCQKGISFAGAMTLAGISLDDTQEIQREFAQALLSGVFTNGKELSND